MDVPKKNNAETNEEVCWYLLQKSLYTNLHRLSGHVGYVNAGSNSMVRISLCTGLTEALFLEHKDYYVEFERASMRQLYKAKVFSNNSFYLSV